jgi:hypothetical protein
VSDVPHGGFKASGLGKVHGELGLQECVRTKAITVDWFQAWRQPWWFGYGPSHREEVDAFLVAAHGASLTDAIRALPKVLRLVFAPKRKI